ncbi:signal transducer and transcription activator isoform X1 [Anopheles merus]|uniref:Signal transducer and activator of transcription n=1 Tax=Anopheles merus TaxID=30066 RepID=A0A3F2YZT4_ANOME|nr:signal transducer and transcription activator isoform X1 [Anopheles merus]XP_041779843.1 signal transducer and transcription activator isoform X1 [Anopheles merus]XP_041779851.1 signal transducer and transcription activator isoform X1 [Anopheles merus]XP_041779860.1 signal transducer and transcription activator isoform X1 [Anopheles merus]XP_041779869.1 signal transducer and transcription activator isoform X1 [Anopheles merus]
MSLWARVNQLPQPILEQIRFIYGSNFPIEVRHYLADWIEERLLNAPVYTNDQEAVYEQDAANFLNQLIMELERTAINLPESNFTIKIRLNESARNFRQLFSHNPAQLYQHLMNCLHRERQCVAYPDECVNVQDPEVTEVFNAVQQLQIMVRTNENDNRNLMKEYEHLLLEVHELQKNRAQLETIENAEMRAHAHNQLAQHQKMVNDRLQLCTGKRLALVDGFRKTILITDEVQNKVLNKYLSQWKINQGFAGNGASMMSASNLDTIQAWCESLAEIIWSTKDQIRLAIKNKSKLHVEQEDVPDLLPQAMVDVTNLLKMLITNTFIIEKQPPQVMKTNTRFAATVRLLVGNTLNIKMVNPQVKVSIISEAQAQQTQQTNKASEQSCGEIMNNIGNLEYNETTKQLSVSFRNMQLKKIKRAEKKGTECVMDEKFALLFQSSFAVGHGDLVFSVWTISLPVVVIVHGNQEPQSWATITWDNAFADINRIPFQVPDKVIWNQLAEALNMKFRASTGRSLTAENMHFLCEKAFKTNLPFPVPNDLTIMWSQFCKEPIPDRSFTFWDWFYAAMKVTREHLRGPWMDGSIIGFIHKSKAEDYLLKCPRGTFLLRFSDSELGGITIAWVNEGNDGQPQILHIQPFTAKDFSTRSLSDRIRDFDDLFYLYPNKPKHEAFDRYTTPAGPPRNKNYIASEVRAVLMPGPTNNQMNSFPNTPSYNIQSPDASRDTPSTGYSVSGRASNASASCVLQHRYVSSFEPYVQSDGFAQSVLAAGTGATLSGLVRPPPALSVLSTSSNCSNSTTTTAGGSHYQQHQGLMEQQHQHQHHLHNHISNHHSPAPGSQNHAHLPQQQFDDATTSLSECGGHDGTAELRSLPSMPGAFSFTGRPFADSGNSSERPNLPVEHQPKGPNVQLPQLSAGHTDSTVAASITTTISSSSSSRRVDSGGDGISCASSRTTSLSSASTAVEQQLSGLEDLSSWLDLNNNTSWS